MRNFVHIVSSAATQFTATISQGMYDTENITIGSGDNSGIIRSVAAGVTDNIAFDVQLYDNSSFNTVPTGIVSFNTTDGAQISSGGVYYYAKQDLKIPYRDLNANYPATMPALHTMFINRSNVGHGGVTGSVILRLGMEVK